MSDDIEKARAAHAALVAAKAACDAAGLAITCGVLSREAGTTDAVAVCIAHAASRIASMERRAVPIAFGDTVRVYDVNLSGTKNKRVVKVGSTLIHIGEGHGTRTYSLADGRMTNHWQGYIDGDDLFRIKRDLVGKRPPKPATTMREVGTVTTATKGDDE